MDLDNGAKIEAQDDGIVIPKNIDITLQYGDCVLLQTKSGYLQSQG